jgi:transposase
MELHGVDETEQLILRRNLSRKQFIAFASKLEPTLLALEACGGSHHRGCFLSSFGHWVKLIPPQRVKPYVPEGRKNDRNDGLHRLGHDDERRKLSGSHPSHLIRSSVPTVEEQ